MLLCLGVSAQQYYVMKITKADGSVIELNADDVQNVTFQQMGEPIVYAPHHFDLTVTVGKQGGMGRDVTTITQSRDRLDQGAVVDFKNAGAEINADYSMEAIVKGKYYYQVPVSADRFVKLQFKDNKMEVVKQRPFKENTYKARNYTHAWLNDNTLLIISTDGEHKQVIWTKLNTDDMTIISEGTLNINVAEGYNVLTTSGVAAYRKSDNKVFYFYYNKKETSGSSKTTNEPFFRIAVIDPETMAVEQEIINKEAAQMTPSAYGELLQDAIFFDEGDNMYVSAFNTVSKKNIGCLLRIKKGEFDLEAGYNGFPGAMGKLLTIQYMGNGKALAYSGDNAVGTSIDAYAYYYSIVDLYNKTVTPLAYNGTAIPYSSGSFSQRTAVDRAAGKAYIGVNTETAQPQIYVYDIKSGEVTEGLKVAEGYYFEQIRLIED
jgi:hypothetical protein